MLDVGALYVQFYTLHIAVRKDELNNKCKLQWMKKPEKENRDE